MKLTRDLITLLSLVEESGPEGYRLLESRRRSADPTGDFDFIWSDWKASSAYEARTLLKFLALDDYEVRIKEKPDELWRGLAEDEMPQTGDYFVHKSMQQWGRVDFDLTAEILAADPEFGTEIEIRTFRPLP